MTKPTQRAVPALLLSCLLPLALVGSALAADTPPALAKFAGQYKYSQSRDHGVAIVEKATEEALSDLGMVMRVIVKKALSSSFAETILIETPSGKIGMKVGELDKHTAEVGKTENVKSQDGKRQAKITYKFDGTRITAHLVSEEMTIVTLLSLGADGKTLQREVTVTGKRLSKPVKYRLIYTRK